MDFGCGKPNGIVTVKNLGPDQERENLRHQGRQCPWSADSKKNSQLSIFDTRSENFWI